MTEYTTQRIPRTEIPGCSLIQDLLPLYLENEVTPESHVLIADHIQRCERCSGYLAGAQSMRGQIIRDQQALKQAQQVGVQVAQVQQPVSNSLGRKIWQFLMVVSWMIGLLVTFIGVAAGEPPPFVVGQVLFFLAVAGFLAARLAGGTAWRVLAGMTGITGLLVIVVGLLQDNEQLGPLGFFAGMILLAVAGWSLLSSRNTVAVQPSAAAQGSTRAVLKAIFSILGAGILLAINVLCAFAIADAPNTGPGAFVAVVAALVSTLGLLELNQRRNWIKDLATPAIKRRLQGWLMLGGGAVWSLLVMQSWGISSVGFMLAVGIGGALLMGGSWWNQRVK